MKKALIATLIVLAVVIGAFFFSAHSRIEQGLFQIKSNKNQPISLVFVGDVMLDRGVRTSVNKYLNGDYAKFFEQTGYLKAADIAFANLEGPVATGGHNVGSRFSFRMDPAALAAMNDAGFDVVSFANNHVGDYATAAFTETLQHLQEHTILAAGAGMNYTQATTPAIITVRGVRIGFLAATDVGPDWLRATDKDPGVLLASDPQLPHIIEQAKQQVDVLVMSYHFGVEYSPANRRQETLAHMAIDHGADIVVGSHPHVMQRVEWYKEKPIFYSLGNFIFDQYFSPNTTHGMVAQVSIDPETKAITATEEVSQEDKHYVPQALAPFNESMLITKPFTP